METWIGQTIAVQILILLAHQTGLIGKVLEVSTDIARCPTCSVMWGTLTILLLQGCDLLSAIALSFFSSYISMWIQIPLAMLARKHEHLWQRTRKQNRRDGTRNQ